MKSRTLGIAATLSVAIHVLALLVPGWRLPEEEDFGGKPLTATLLAAPTADVRTAAPRPAAPKPPPPKPAPPIADAPTASLGDAPKAEASAPQSAPVVASDAPSAPVAELASAPAAPEQSTAVAAESPPAPLADVDSAWARQGRVRYSSTYYGLPIVGEQTWQRDAAQFSATLSGSVPFKGELIKQESSGRIVGGRPVSDTFRETFNAAQYETRFDVAGNTVEQTRKGAPRTVETGGYALDMLALTHFMALQPVEEGRSFDVFVVTFRGSVSRVTVEQRAARKVELPLGGIVARQFHAEARNGALKIDVWLAANWQNAPVRIRVEDAGGTYDLKAEEVELDGIVLARAISSGEAE